MNHYHCLSVCVLFLFFVFLFCSLFHVIHYQFSLRLISPASVALVSDSFPVFCVALCIYMFFSVFRQFSIVLGWCVVCVISVRCVALITVKVDFGVECFFLVLLGGVYFLTI